MATQVGTPAVVISTPTQLMNDLTVAGNGAPKHKPQGLNGSGLAFQQYTDGETFRDYIWDGTKWN